MNQLEFKPFRNCPDLLYAKSAKCDFTIYWIHEGAWTHLKTETVDETGRSVLPSEPFYTLEDAKDSAQCFEDGLQNNKGALEINKGTNKNPIHDAIYCVYGRNANTCSDGHIMQGSKCNWASSQIVGWSLLPISISEVQDLFKVYTD